MSMGSESSNTKAGKPYLYDYKQLTPRWQQLMQTSIAPRAFEEAMGQGLSPTDQNRMLTQSNANINRTAQATMSGLKNQYANAGIEGGMLADALSDVGEAKVTAAGQASQDLQNTMLQQKNEKWKNLLAMALNQPPFAAGSTGGGGSSSGFKIGI